MTHKTITVHDLHTVFQDFAPFSLQESYDNSGLQVGSYTDEIAKILCAIDITEAVIEEAKEIGADCIIAHHPLIFKKLQCVSDATYVERCVRKAIQYNIVIYCVHTNLDMVTGGVNSKICSKLGLQNTQILSPHENQLYKIITFIPHAYASKVMDAMTKAGAGHIGNYDSCSFSVRGEGRFRALHNAKPFVGKKNTVHTEEETRIEMICPEYAVKQVVETLLSHHPYEEVAYDVFRSENHDPYIGAGMIGEFEKPIHINECISLLKKIFNISHIKLTQAPYNEIKKVAVCGGSGSFLIHEALRKKADMFITADIKYHEFFMAENKMIIADIGHYESEQYTKEIFYDLVIKNFPKFAIHFSQVNTNPIKYL
ncbi:MAG: Nif3-like dinuclear metal center hexameric protein [Bacteroidales bacterium]